MRVSCAVTLLVGLVASGTACRDISKDNAAQLQAVEQAREKQLEQRLAKADTDPKHAEPLAMWMMPPELREISGLALTSDGRLLTHDDEVGRIYEIDPRRGVILKRFMLGDTPVRADFESIAVGAGSVYLLASNGVLYEFKEGADGAHVPYSIHDLKLGHECEFEGMAYQADSASLLLPCKRAAKKSLHDQLVIYRWRLQGPDSTRLSMFTIPLAQVVGANGWKGFHASDMTIDPTTGNYVLISHLELGLVEITPAGQVVRSGPLPGKHHQPEGVAITRDGMLIVSDEGSKKPAAITLYRWRP
jgi:uncharacterized protein YjiK